MHLETAMGQCAKQTLNLQHLNHLYALDVLIILFLNTQQFLEPFSIKKKLWFFFSIFISKLFAIYLLLVSCSNCGCFQSSNIAIMCSEKEMSPILLLNVFLNDFFLEISQSSKSRVIKETDMKLCPN